MDPSYRGEGGGGRTCRQRKQRDLGNWPAQLECCSGWENAHLRDLPVLDQGPSLQESQLQAIKQSAVI